MFKFSGHNRKCSVCGKLFFSNNKRGETTDADFICSDVCREAQAKEVIHVSDHAYIVGRKGEITKANRDLYRDLHGGRIVKDHRKSH